MVVMPETLIGWHQRVFQLFRRWKFRGGRLRLQKNLQTLIAEMAQQRTVRNYWPEDLRPIKELQDEIVKSLEKFAAGSTKPTTSLCSSFSTDIDEGER